MIATQINIFHHFLMKNTHLVIIVLLVILAGGIGYMALQKNEPAQIPVTSEQSQNQENTQQQNPPSEGLKTYTDGNISFQYPKEWKTMNNVEFAKFAGWETMEKDGTPKKPELNQVYLVSPDAIPDKRDGMGVLVTSGFVIQVGTFSKTDLDSVELAQTFADALEIEKDSIKELNESGNRFHLETVAVAGGNAFISDARWEGLSLSAHVYGKDEIVKASFAFYPVDQTGMDKGWTILKSILATVKIK